MAVDNIITLAGRFKNLPELQDYCNQQYRTLQRCHDEISALQAEIRHLKEMLTHIPVPGEVSTIVVSDDQAICEVQIQRLKEVALDRDLTLDETKRLDLLMKNLYLAKKQNAQTLEGKSSRIPAVVTHDDLLRIASSAPPPPVEPEQ